jgi:hypothetical protein
VLKTVGSTLLDGNIIETLRQICNINDALWYRACVPLLRERILIVTNADFMSSIMDKVYPVIQLCPENSFIVMPRRQQNCYIESTFDCGASFFFAKREIVPKCRKLCELQVNNLREVLSTWSKTINSCQLPPIIETTHSVVPPFYRRINGSLHIRSRARAF